MKGHKPPPAMICAGLEGWSEEGAEQRREELQRMCVSDSTVAGTGAPHPCMCARVKRHRTPDPRCAVARKP
ncbi:MAG: hypothetical protein ACPIOQ_09210, partial [Promethearchaeia archaeon]